MERGYAEVKAEVPAVRDFERKTVQLGENTPEQPSGDFTLVLYPTVALLDGRHALNPWLQELPDPVTKVTWDNYACLSPATAAGLGVEDGDVVRIGSGAADGEAHGLELPVLIQPGQHDRVVAVALGYGRQVTSVSPGSGRSGLRPGRRSAAMAWWGSTQRRGLRWKQVQSALRSGTASRLPRPAKNTSGLYAAAP